MNRATWLAGAVALLATACSKPPPAPGGASAPAAPAATASAAPAEPPAMRLRGVGVVGKDGYGITLCGEQAQRITTLDPAAQAVLDAFIGASRPREFRLDARGDFVGRDKLRIRRFERLATEGLDCDERESRFTVKANGTEPFWHLAIDGGQGSFSRPDHDEASGAVKDTTDADGTRHYEMDTLAGHIMATISPGTCNDDMADMTYGWKAEVVTAGETLKGCAYTGQ